MEEESSHLRERLEFSECKLVETDELIDENIGICHGKRSSSCIACRPRVGVAYFFIGLGSVARVQLQVVLVYVW